MTENPEVVNTTSIYRRNDREVVVTVKLATTEPMTWGEAQLAAALALLHDHGPKRTASVDVTGAIREVDASTPGEWLSDYASAVRFWREKASE